MNSESWTLKLLCSTLYTLGWIICVFGGAAKWTILPLLTTAVITIPLLVYLFTLDRSLGLGTLILLAYGSLFGLAMETLFISLDWLSYATTNSLSPVLPPGWLWCLYFLFLPTLKLALDPLRRSYLAAALFGMLGAPLSYLAGATIGAVRLSSTYSVLGIGLCWAVYMLLIVYLDRRLKQRLLFNIR